MSNENELLEPLATEAGQQAIARAINNLSSLEYAVRAERAATTATQKADEASNSADDASDYATEARNWATKTDGYVDQETITIPPEQEGDDPTTETIDLYSARYYASLAQDIYNNLQFDTVPTENSTNLLSSGSIYDALNLKADKSTTYTKTEVDTQISTAVSNLVNSAPSTLDTLEELADALGDDPNFATTIATQLGNKADKSDTYTKTEVDTALGNVQSTLTFDNVPTANSDNPVKSSGIKTALDGKQDTLIFDSTPTANSTNPVTSGGVYTALQNVNIDIDDEITANSDNPVTSAAIYEALQNFTPSGGGGGAGNASGVIVETIYTGNDSTLNIGDELNLSKSWKDYDVLEFVFFPKGATLVDPNPYCIQRFVTTKTIQDCYSISNVFRIALFANEDNNNVRLVTLRVPSETKFVVNTNGSNNQSLNIKYINGIKFSKNLSEQMYSNVLYENSSGVNSGTITLNDGISNYDFIKFRLNRNGNEYMDKIVSKDTILYGSSTNNKITTLDFYDNDYYCLQYTSDTTLSTYSVMNIKIVEITGIKMAKGGYSGIVSDARMTVKSGTVQYTSTLSGNVTVHLPVVFDSPMPDTNYVVQVTPNFGGTGWANAEVTTSDKTINGFNIIIFGMHGSTTVKPKYDWIAIRPNSYTREGMVEDVLFSNASGVNSGTINLSGNISDYDLIQVFTTSDNTLSGVHYQHDDCYLLTATEMLYTDNANSRLHYRALGNQYIMYNVQSDNSINIKVASGIYLTKITGIKFGRYVSGVAVDTTVTQNSNAVVTSGAVYDALQNAGGGGGGGSSSSITIDSTPTENSQNAVSSGGVYTALQNIPSENVKTEDNTSNFFEYKVPSDAKVQSANEVLYVAGGRTYYKKYDGVAAAILTYVPNNTHAVLVSDNEDAVKTYSSYNPNVVTSASTITVNDQTFYYSASIYGWDGNSVEGVTDCYIKKVNQSFSSNEAAARYIVNNILENYVNLKQQVEYICNKIDGSTVDTTITENSQHPVTSAAIYTALDGKADKSTTYTKTEVDTALGSKQGTLTFDTTPTADSTNPVTSGGIYTALQNLPTGTGDVTTNTDQNITGTKTFVGSKKIAFKQSATNDKLGFTLFSNSNAERGYLEFNPQNTIDGVAGLMTLGNYATSAASLTQVGFRRYSNISGASGAYNLLMPMVADARTPFSLTTTYQNFYLPLGFTDGTTTVKTAKSGVVDLSPLFASLEARIAALEGN